MNTISILANRNTTSNIPEVYYIQDNKISSIRIQLPPKIGDYNREECSIELRAVLPDGDYISYTIPNDSKSYDWQPTIDITEKSQLVNLVFIITADGGVIGRTKPIQLNIQVNPDKGEELTPREQFDIVIREQRAEIAEQAETINSQASQIEQDEQTISGLNTQVSELTTENEQQAETITRQNQTIDQLNSRVPALQQLDPINPSNIQQTYNPESPNIGFPQVIVNPPTAEGVGFNENYYKEGETCLGEVGTYNPFPYESQGGIFILEMNTQLELPSKILIKDYVTAPNTALTYGNFIFFNGITALEELIVEGSPSIAGISGYLMFNHGGANIKKIDLSKSFISFVGERGFSFSTGSSLEELYFSDSLTRLDKYAIQNATALTRLNLGNSLISIGDVNMHGCSALERIELPDTLEIIGAQFCRSCEKLRTINFPKSLQSINSIYLLDGCTSLEYVTIENGFNCDNLVLSASTKYSVETIVSWLEALADRTGETAYTLTIGTLNINKLTAEQIAIATNKNWNLT